MEKLKDLKIFNIRLEGDDWKALVAMGKRNKVSAAFVIRYILHKFILDKKDFQITDN